jgi:hypothetical protein
MIPENAPDGLKEAETADAVVQIIDGDVVWLDGVWRDGT